MTHDRLNQSLLAREERQALSFLVERLPTFVTPNHLTAAGLFGAATTAGSLVAAHVSSWFLVPAIFGLVLNWFGDSLDGTLARHRKIERPRYGYFIDHSTDLIAQTLIIGGLGFSPYFTLISALLVLSMYLLMSSYTYLKVMVQGTHHLSYGGMGATEFRLLVAAWSLFAACIGPTLTQGRILDHAGLDVVIGSLWCLTFFAFIWIVRSDLNRIGDETRPADEAQEGAEEFSAVTG
ncbi:MAG TPA: CDP-alcohol phosphatidyltransferase family protein [Methylocystis sp.]|nr:CDP-alcohol phosphatidyltransferase family protein [Methylocystis sp.]